MARYGARIGYLRKQLKQEEADFERVLEAILRVMQPAWGGTLDGQAFTALATTTLLLAAGEV